MFPRAVGDFKAPRCDLLYSTVTGRRTRIAFDLPPRKLHKLRIRPQAR